MHPFENPVKKILLVCADLTQRQDLSQFLEATAKFVVFPHVSGSDALDAQARWGRIDAIVADFHEMEKGSPLLQYALREGIPTLLMTPDFSETVRALRSYALKIPVLKQPVDPTKLALLLLQYTGGERTGGAPYLAAWWDEPEMSDDNPARNP